MMELSLPPSAKAPLLVTAAPPAPAPPLAAAAAAAAAAVPLLPAFRSICPFVHAEVATSAEIYHQADQ